MKNAAQIVVLMLEDGLEKVCAWCQQERGEEPRPGQSHGICQRHKEALMKEMAAMKRQAPVAQMVQTPPPV